MKANKGMIQGASWGNGGSESERKGTTPFGVLDSDGLWQTKTKAGVKTKIKRRGKLFYMDGE